MTTIATTSTANTATSTPVSIKDLNESDSEDLDF